MGRKKKRKKAKVEKAKATEPNDLSKNMALYIPRHIHDEIMFLIDHKDYEVSGFGTLEYNEEHNYFVVTDVSVTDRMILKQKVNKTATEITAEAKGKAMYQLRDTPGALKWHWHSHVQMGVFWSADDMEIIRSLGQQGWIVATVFNQRRESRTAFYSGSKVMDKSHDVFFDDLKTHVYHNLSDERQKELIALYEANVEIEKPAAVVTAVTPYVRSCMDDDGWDPYGYAERHKQELREAKADRQFDKWGYYKNAEEWFYNPLKDSQLTTEEEKIMAVDCMTQREIDFLKDDNEFQKLLQKYMVLAAKMDAEEGGDIEDVEELEEVAHV